MYVGAASQHVLHMSFVPEQEAQNFDKQVMTFWSHLFIVMPPPRCSFHLSNLGDLVWALQFSGTKLFHGVLGNRSFPHKWKQPSHQTQQTLFSTQHQDSGPTPHSSQKMNKPAFLLTALRLQNTQKTQVSTIQETFASNYLKASPHHNLLHTPELTSCSPAAKRTRLRIALRVSVAKRMVLPHPAAANAADVVQSCSKKKCGGCDLQQTSGPETASLPRLQVRRWC